MTPVIIETNFSKLRFIKRGKVRDMYEVGGYYLIVATDRLSAYDVILPQGIPDKGKVLTQISKFWFDLTKGIIKNHVVSTNVDDFPAECEEYAEQLRGRSMLVKKTRPLGVECIVRGYLSGSGWAEYQEMKSVCGLPLPAGLVESSRLPAPIFTPSTKAELGVHDENITFEEMMRLEGEATSKNVRDIAIHIFNTASEIAEAKGIIIADTKMEFGTLNDELILIDELLTPDSSRFWPKSKYTPGGSQPSFDKQFVRDYLTSIKFNRRPPGPMMPEEIIEKTAELYREALFTLTGKRVE